MPQPPTGSFSPHLLTPQQTFPHRYDLFLWQKAKISPEIVSVTAVLTDVQQS